MGEFVYSIAENVLEGLGSAAYQEIFLAWGVTDEVHNLKETFLHIKIVVLDAEEKQRKNALLTQWLGELKDVCYDIDNVLDEFAFRELRMQLLNHGSVKGKVGTFCSRWNPFVFNFKMVHRIKSIRERLDVIAVEKASFHLMEQAPDLHGVPIKRETHSFVQEPDVVGRDVDKKTIIIHLLNLNLKETSHGDDENVSVISITGLGGIGKTTLAKLVYNDNRIVKNFELRIWVCVSDHFDIRRVVREIITSTTNENCGDHESLELMKNKLHNALKDKQFLLVLDDVWDKNQIGVTKSKWNDLKALLNVGATGSKILVTTRSELVASIMGSTRVHSLGGLPHKDCMSLLIKGAFGQKGEEQSYPHLIAIGDDIAQKCGGVPLAVSTLGSVLNLRRDEHAWSDVRDNDIWKLEQGDDDILPALKLSYDALPPHLKPCFAFCSLFPKGYQFSSYELIPLWMGQGFLQPSKGSQEFEETGLDYIRQLCSRSLFQIDEDCIHAIKFQMHHLVHDLAISVAQVECSSVNFRPSTPNPPKRVRHVSISRDDLSIKEDQVPEFLLQLKRVWTILFPSLAHMDITNESLLKTCIRKFKYLRVLDLSGSTLEVLPSSIGNLCHLRYLNLSKSPGLQKLPESICKLHNLQTLLLSDCEKLKELPKGIENLINLRTLVLTTNQVDLPEGIQRLTSLRLLQIHNCSDLKSFGEGMQRLTNLRMLVITNCGSLESLPHNMEYLTALKTLVISDCEKLDLMGSGEGIRGLRSFSVSKISNLKALPPWLQESANTLQSIRIETCEDLTTLPEWLQKFKLLQQLVIGECPQLLALPEGMRHLAALRELKISGCSTLSERCKRKEGKDWPKIAHIAKITLDGENI